VQAYHVPHVFSEGRDEEQAHARSGFRHRPIEEEGPAFDLDL
jgi:hypothetical protein